MLGIGCPDRHALQRITSPKLRTTATPAPLPRAGSFIGAQAPTDKQQGKPHTHPALLSRGSLPHFAVFALDPGEAMWLVSSGCQLIAIKSSITAPMVAAE